MKLFANNSEESGIKTLKKEFLAKALRRKVLNVRVLFLGGSAALPTGQAGLRENMLFRLSPVNISKTIRPI